MPDVQFLCADHYQSWEKGLLDRCPKCGRFKDVMYQLCLDCHFGLQRSPWKPLVEIPSAPKRNYRVEYSDACTGEWPVSDKFFVYMLEIDGGGLYVGYTADLTKSLSAYRNQKADTAKTIRLQYAQVVGGKQAAEMRKSELEKLIKSNLSQIQLMIDDFLSHMRDFGYE